MLKQVSLMVLLVCAGCASAPGSSNASFAPELGVDLARMTPGAGGMYTQDLVVGQGAEARSGRTVVVHYVGWLWNGRKFDSSVDRGTPIDFVLGRGNVIRGWDEGIEGMRAGGKRRLVIPPAMAYGTRGAGNGEIPGNATLVFDVQLLEVR